MDTTPFQNWTLRLSLGCLMGLVVSFTEPQYPLPERSRADTRTTASELPKCETTGRSSFLAVGDIMLSRGVNRAIERSGDPLHPFSHIAEILGSTDFNFGNLESPVSGRDERIGKGLVFNAHRRNVEGLVRNNFKVVALANNHALDQGDQGLRFTRQYLAGAGVTDVGAGENLAEAWTPKVITASGLKIGFIAAAYSSVNDGGQVRNRFVARIDDAGSLRASIRQARSMSDIVVVAMHAGVEYRRRPHSTQVDFARAAIDAGADIVIGSHPHWIQTVEEYRGKYIFYSLGNFVFDQRQPGTTDGLMLRVSLARDECIPATADRVYLDKIELIPVIIDPGGVPRLASGTESAAILNKIGISEATLRPPQPNGN